LAISVILRRRALPCAISQNAGRYLCNAAYFKALAVDRPVLFLHIPKPPRLSRRAAADSPRRRSAWSDAIANGFVDVAIALLRQARRQRLRAEVAASAPAR
jgi:pyroglutamyl-peptidase